MANHRAPADWTRSASHPWLGQATETSQPSRTAASTRAATHTATPSVVGCETTRARRWDTREYRRPARSGCALDADDRRTRHRPRRSQEDGIAEGEDAAVLGHQPVPA